MPEPVDYTVRPKRYLLFADILGTQQLYSAAPPKSDLIEFKRSALGHCIRTAIFPFFHPDFDSDLHINVFSDTVLIASPNLRVLMKSAADLFRVFCRYSLSADSLDELYLLRGGVSHGEVLSSHSLTSARSVDVASIFDTSLAFAYRLEGLRKGSRIFLSQEAYEEAVRQHIIGCLRWEAITGIGAPLSPAFEYLWASTLFNDNCFEQFLSGLFSLWCKLFRTKKAWAIDEYDRALYQLDETIKLFIRSSVYAPTDRAPATVTCLKNLLPTTNPALAKFDIKYIWGIWFQVLKAILMLYDTYNQLLSGPELKDLVAKTLANIDVLGYTPTFFHELENPDYADFKNRLASLEVD